MTARNLGVVNSALEIGNNGNVGDVIARLGPTEVGWLTLGAQIQTATVALTNAQLKALPTTPIAVIAAPGAGLAIVVLSATIAVDATAGAYTNIDPAATLGLIYAAGGAASGVLDEAVGAVTDLLGVASANLAVLSGAGGAGPATGISNNAVQVSADNNGAGNFTGGNAANGGTVTVRYQLIPA